jgi:hypothetical protein
MKNQETQTLDGILQCAIILNWRELMRDSQRSSVRVEYYLGPGGSLQHLRVLSSHPRSGMKVVCEYRTQSAPERTRGLAFSNGYQSAELAQMLEFIMRHEAIFPRGFSCTADRHVQVLLPTREDTTSALFAMGQVMTRFPDRNDPFVDRDLVAEHESFAD